MKVISILSVLLVAVAVTQAAPSPAAIQQPVPYTAENPDDPYDKRSGVADLDLNFTEDSLTIPCWNKVSNGRFLTITCNAKEWTGTIVCSDYRAYK
ncbi:hypothetical protein BGZ65_002177, partial [Modicella reniformis]